MQGSHTTMPQTVLTFVISVDDRNTLHSPETLN